MLSSLIERYYRISVRKGQHVGVRWCLHARMMAFFGFLALPQCRSASDILAFCERTILLFFYLQATATRIGPNLSHVAWKVFGQMIYSQSLKISLGGALCLKGLHRGVSSSAMVLLPGPMDCTAVHWEMGLANGLLYIFAPSLPNASTRFSSPSFFVIVLRVHLWSQCQSVSPKAMRLIHSSESTRVS